VNDAILSFLDKIDALTEVISKTSWILDDGGSWVSGPDLPKTNRQHCHVAMNDQGNEFMVVTGWTTGNKREAFTCATPCGSWTSAGTIVGVQRGSAACQRVMLVDADDLLNCCAN